MINWIIHSKSRQTLLSFFIKNQGQRAYLRQLQRLTGVPVGALQRELGALEKESFLRSEKEGPLKYFSLNQDYPYLPELKSLFFKEARRRLLKKNLRRILKILKEKYRPDRVILYGSFASGKTHADSDLDLLIVKRDVPPRYWDRVKELAPLLADRDVGLDYTVWTPEELKKESGNLFLQEEILRKGKVVYERAA